MDHDVRIRATAAAGFLGVLLFPVAILVVNIVQGGQHNPLTQPASQLALGTAGWAMDAGFLGLAAGTLLIAYAVARTLGSYKSVPVVLLAIAGLLGFIPAFVPTDPNGVTPTTHGMVHNLNGLATFVLYVAAMITAAFTFRRSLYWQPLQRTTAVFAGLGVIAFLLLLGLGAASLFGLGERVAIAVWVAWLLVVAWRAFSVTELEPTER